MKLSKSNLLILICGIVAITALIGAGILFGIYYVSTQPYFPADAQNILEGKAICAKDTTYLLTENDELVRLLDKSESGDLFDDVQTGDTIRVAQETGNGVLGTIACVLLEHGDENNVKDSTVAAVPLGERVEYSSGYAGMALTLPEGWDYKIIGKTNNLNTFGIQFWPEGYTNSYVRLDYYINNGFGVCGTGLRSEAAVIAGYEASIGTYIPSEHWSYVSFQNTPGCYSLWRHGSADWSEEHEKQLTAILNTIELAPQYPDGLLCEEDALALAEEYTTATDYESPYAHFMYETGEWAVTFSGEHYSDIIQRVYLSAVDGSLVEIDESARYGVY